MVALSYVSTLEIYMYLINCYIILLSYLHIKDFSTMFYSTFNMFKYTIDTMH